MTHDAAITPTRIVAAARTYLGAAFVHQGRTRAHGVDCAGLVACVAYDLGVRDVRITDYTPQPDQNRFRAILREHLAPIAYAELEAGDVVTFTIVGREQHLGIITDAAPLRFIHAYQTAGRVVEQLLDPTWRRRLRGCYRFRLGGANGRA